MDSVIFAIETLKENPIEMLGEYTLRARQDRFFNGIMLKALNAYIDEKGIRWDDKYAPV